MAMRTSGARFLPACAVLVGVFLLTVAGSSGRPAPAAVLDDDALGSGLLRSAIGSFFGLDKGVVGAYHDRQRLSPSQIILTMYLARLAGIPHAQVAASRSRGHGWGVIAHDLGIHPGTFNQMRKGLDPGKARDRDLEDAALQWFIATYHGAPRRDVSRWKSRGHSPVHIFVALDLASKCGAAPADVLALRHRGKSWQAIAANLGLSASDLQQPSKPKGGQAFRGAKGKSEHSPGKGAGKPPGPPGGKSSKSGKPGGGPKNQ